MDAVASRLLNCAQKSFPLVPRPYSILGAGVGLSEAETLARIATLRRERIIRQISAIFDTRALGYQSTLVAARVAPDRLLQAARVFNGHPGVSHNYERDNSFNIWFTIAVPPESSLEGTVARLGSMGGVESIRLLPTLRLFKIGVNLDVAGEYESTATTRPDYTQSDRDAATTPLTEQDKMVIRAIQEDLPVTEEPFEEASRQAGMSVEDLLQRSRELLERKYLRRFAAILYHRRAGFKANCMAVWQIPEEREIEAGESMAKYAAVSHCYLRPVYPDWPYNLFTMIHGRTTDECEAVIQAITRETEPKGVDRIYSVREFKKTRVRYFTPEFQDWERARMKPSEMAAG